MYYKIVALVLVYSIVFSQNVGIGIAAPGSKLSVRGNLSVGSSYAGSSAPTNGAIIEGHVGIGTALPDAILHIHNTDGTLVPSLHLTDNFTGAFPVLLAEHSEGDYVFHFRTASSVSGGHIPRIYFERADGTLSAPLALRSDQWIGAIVLGGHDGTDWTQAGVGGGCEAGILFYSGGNWTPTSHPVEIVFKTTDVNSTCGSPRMNIKPNGFVGINNQNPTEMLDVNGKIYTSLGLKPNYESAWVTVASNNSTTLTFNTGFLPTRVTVLVQMQDCSGNWVDLYTYIPPCETSWDDMYTANKNCYYLTSTSVKVWHEGVIRANGTSIHDGCNAQRIKVLAWK